MDFTSNAQQDWCMSASDDKSRLQGLTAKADAAAVSNAPVHSFMSKNTVSVPEGTKIYSAIQMLIAHNVGSAPVINRSQNIIGVISEHDLLLQTATLDVASPIVFTKNPVVVEGSATLSDALLILYKKKVRRLPVVEAGKVIGIITRMDILSRLIGKGRK